MPGAGHTVGTQYILAIVIVSNCFIGSLDQP